MFTIHNQLGDYMNIRKTPWIMTILAVGFTASAVTLEERIAALEEEAAYQKLQTGSTAKSVDSQDKELQALRKAMDKIKVSGDVRARYEYINQETATKPTIQSRLRFRARVNIDSALDKEWFVGVQLATNPGDPTSGNTSMGNGFDGKGIGFERAYVRYTPEFLPELRAFVGKIPQPWIAVSDLVWDGDINPEGIAIVGEVKFDDIALLANAGFFQINGTHNNLSSSSTATTREPIRLYTAQMAGRVNLDSDTRALAGVGVYYWDNLDGKNPASSFGFTSRGQNNGGANYDRNYCPVELFGSVDSKVMEIPVGVFGQYVRNSNGNVDKYGYLLGVKVGRASAGKCEVSYDYRHLGRDATVAAYSDSDSWGGGTNGKGHRLGVRYGLTSAVQLGATGFWNSYNLSTTARDYKRLQLDIAARF